MDYLRQVGGSKEAAKELKLFNLSEYLTDRFAGAFGEDLRGKCCAVACEADWWPAFGILGTLGYYGSYAFVI